MNSIEKPTNQEEFVKAWGEAKGVPITHTLSFVSKEYSVVVVEYMENNLLMIGEWIFCQEEGNYICNGVDAIDIPA